MDGPGMLSKMARGPSESVELDQKTNRLDDPIAFGIN